MTEREWSEWIRECRRTREKVYRSDADEVTANYDREVGHVRDYHGREVLELLQNADDAGRGYGPNCVHMVLRPYGLCIGNTGTPFSPRGVKSLVLSDSSPKREARTEYIGNRGLGFRSVLNWTECPFVLSGTLRLGFDKKRSEDWFRRLALDDAHVRERIETRQSAGQPFPAPILGVPFEIPSDSVAAREFSAASNYTRTLDIALSLRAGGCDTVIGIPFTVDDAFAEVQRQIAQLSEEVLLFLNHLARLDIDASGVTRCWRVVERRENEVILDVDRAKPRKWFVHRRDGDVPAEQLRSDQLSTPRYEVRIAVPEDGRVRGALFNFLPTEARFPFGAVAHATLELTNNRQNIATTRANRFIAAELARAFADAAERHATAADPWRATKMVAAAGDLDPVLEAFGFAETLTRELTSRTIIPCRDGTMRSAEGGAVRLRCDPRDWLPVEGFGDLVEWTNDRTITRLLDDLNVPRLGESELRERLDGISPTLALDDRAKLIAGLISHGLMTTPPPSLLLGTDGEVIVAEHTVFLPPAGGEQFDLPHWLSLRFLHRDLTTRLYATLGVQSAHDLRIKLSAYEIRLYSLTSVARAINARIEERVEAAAESEHAIRLEGLHAIKKLFEQGGMRDDPQQLTGAAVLVPDRGGTFQPASSLYFDREYGKRGTLCDALYSFAGDEAFVSPPTEFGWESDVSAAADFLAWLGVADAPRISKVTIARVEEAEYFEWMMRRLYFPVRFGDHDVHTASDLSAWVRVKVADATSFDRLEEVLRHADPHAILAWLAIDDRVEALRREHDKVASLTGAPTSRHDPRRMRDQAVPSYALWLVESKEWVPVHVEGTASCPQRCIIEPPGARELGKIFPVARFDADHPVLRDLRIDARLRRGALERAGVRPTPADFSWDECYELLLQLPELDPKGNAAGKLYGLILEKAGRPERGIGPVQRFHEDGLLWSVHGEVARYRPRAEVYYFASRMVPSTICEAVPIISLPPTYSASRVAERLGVKAVGPDDLDVSIEHHDPLPQAERFARDVEELKFFVAAYRFSANSESPGLARLRDLEVILCATVSGTATIGETTVPIVLEADGAFVLDDTRAYVLYRKPLPDRAFDVPELAASVAELFAAVLGVQEQTTYELLAMYAPARRAEVLSRLIGRDVEPVLAEMRERLPELQRPIPRQRRPAPPPPEAHSTEQLDPGATRTEGEPSTGTPRRPTVDPPDGVTVVPREIPLYLPQPERGRPIEFRIKATPGAVFHPARDGYWTADARLGETIAQQFEEAQGRSVLVVAHLQGEETLHCDLLSFRNEDDRAEFQRTLDHDLIERLIEVKSSTNERGEVVLGDKVATTAREYAERFFLYRVYIGHDDHYKLVALQNPMGYDWPTLYRVNPLVGGRSEYWELRSQRVTNESAGPNAPGTD
ncbi:MAG TPA: DUF3883 domain-containing protein [Rhodothermales bacterium]